MPYKYTFNQQQLQAAKEEGFLWGVVLTVVVIAIGFLVYTVN